MWPEAGNGSSFAFLNDFLNKSNAFGSFFAQLELVGRAAAGPYDQTIPKYVKKNIFVRDVLVHLHKPRGIY